MSPTNPDNDKWDDAAISLAKAVEALLAAIRSDDSDLSPFVNQLAEALDTFKNTRGM